MLGRLESVVAGCAVSALSRIARSSWVHSPMAILQKVASAKTAMVFPRYSLKSSELNDLDENTTKISTMKRRRTKMNKHKLKKRKKKLRYNTKISRGRVTH